jgi:serine/threonine protein kinase
MPGLSKLPGCEGHKEFTARSRTVRAEGNAYVLRRFLLFENSPLTRLISFARWHNAEFGDFLDKILVLDPKKRLTANQALDHDWLWTDPLPTDPAQ